MKHHQRLYCYHPPALVPALILPTVYSKPLEHVDCLASVLLQRQTRMQLEIAVAIRGEPF